MTTNWKRVLLWGLLFASFGLFLLVTGPSPAIAAGPGAVLYEVTEDMYLFKTFKADGSYTAADVFAPDPSNPTKQPGARVATAQLSGWAAIGSPICPQWVVLVSPGATRCTVNATGSDNLSLAPDQNIGQGSVGGTYAVVVQGDNAVDAPEFVVTTGSFYGRANLAPAVLGGHLGYVTSGVLVTDPDPFTGAQNRFSFSGTFRLPFAKNSKGEDEKPRRGHDAFYQADNGRSIRVQRDELSLGWPTVRLEVSFP